MSIQDLSNVAGLLSLGLTLFVGVFVAIYMIRSGISKQSNDAQSSAIDAMQARMATLDRMVEDIKKENERLERILEALIDTLKSREIYITIQGHTISIREGKETTVTRISDEAK